MSGSRLSGALLILLSAVCFGIMPLFGRVAYAAHADPHAILMGRFSIAALCLCALMLIKGESWPRGRVLVGLLLMGAIGYAGQSLCYFLSLQHASASLTALLLYTFPIIVTLIAAVWLHEPLTRRKIIALLLATGGLALTVGDALHGSLLGIVFGLGAAMIYSVYIAVGTKITPGVGALASSAVVMAGASLSFFAATLFHPPAWPQQTAGWLAILAIGVICSVVAALAFFAGLARIGAGESAMLSTLEPVVTIALAAWLLDERMASQQWLGGAVIIAAVLMLAWAPRRAAQSGG